MAQAARFYKEQLRHSEAAIAYLKGRGLTGEIAARYGIGYAPGGSGALRSAFPDYGAKALAEAGLVIDQDDGRRYDRFRDRIMFPILDGRSNVIAFGGRVLGQGEPKYLNSPETPLFEKGRELYGLVQARQGIRDESCVIVVEGYMDVVALAQYSIANAVATLGTATTPVHIQKLFRQTDRIVFCFDGDAAGRKAAWKALGASLENLADDKSVAFLFLAAEHDPDSFVRSEGTEAFRAAAQGATPFAEFLLRHLQSSCETGTAEGRARLVHEARPLVTRLAAPLLRLQVIKMLARISELTQPEIEQAFGLKPSATTPVPRNHRSAPRGRPARRPPMTTQGSLLRLMIHNPALAARVPIGLVDQATDEGRALSALIDAMDVGDLDGHEDLGALLEHFRSTPHAEALARHAGELLEREFDEETIEALFEDTLRKLAEQQREQEFAELAEKLKRQGLSAEERRRYADLLQSKNEPVWRAKVSDP
jgi:DNA primase